MSSATDGLGSLLALLRRVGGFVLDNVIDPVGRRLGYVRPRAYGLVVLRDRLVPQPFDLRYKPTDSYRLLSAPADAEHPVPDLSVSQDATVVDTGIPAPQTFAESTPAPQRAAGTRPPAPSPGLRPAPGPGLRRVPPAPGEGWAAAIRDSGN